MRIDSELYDELSQSLKNGSLSVSTFLSYGIEYDRYRDALNEDFIKRVLVDKLVEFTDIVEAYKNSTNLFNKNESHFPLLISNVKLFQELLHNNLISVEDLRKLWKVLSNSSIAPMLLTTNNVLFKHLIDNDILTVKEYLEALKGIPVPSDRHNECSTLRNISYNSYNAEVLCSVATSNDWRYFLTLLENPFLLMSRNQSFMSYLLKNCIIDENIVDSCFGGSTKFFENLEYWATHIEDYDGGYFERIRATHEIAEEFVVAIDFCRFVHSHSSELRNLFEDMNKAQIAYERFCDLRDLGLLESFKTAGNVVKHLLRVEKKTLLSI